MGSVSWRGCAQNGALSRRKLLEHCVSQASQKLPPANDQYPRLWLRLATFEPTLARIWSTFDQCWLTTRFRRHKVTLNRPTLAIGALSHFPTHYGLFLAGGTSSLTRNYRVSLGRSCPTCSALWEQGLQRAETLDHLATRVEQMCFERLFYGPEGCSTRNLHICYGEHVLDHSWILREGGTRLGSRCVGRRAREPLPRSATLVCFRCR